MKQCPICGRGFMTFRDCCPRCLAFVLLRDAIAAGGRSDWPPPPPPLPTQVTHRDFMIGPYTPHPSFTWRAQLVSLLAHKHIRLED